MIVNSICIKKIYALPRGMERVKIGNWTKTREIYEINGDEKKLNSENLDMVRNINFNENLNQLEIFNNLYTERTKAMRKVSDLNSSNGSLIKGNKVLRTTVKTSEPFNFSNYNTIKTWVGSDINPTWEEEALGSKIITWPSYVEPLEYKDNESPIEWRMLEGKFELSKEQLELIESKKIQPVIGIESNDNFHLVLPFCDLINVFINEEITDINYKAINPDYKFKTDNSNNTIGNYQNINLADNKKYCNKEMDKYISNHTHNKHIDCNILKSKTSNNYYNMVGDISQYIKPEVNEYKISLLIGQLGRMGENILDYNGGTSKITLFLIENPKFKVNIKPYTLNEGEGKKYIGENYKFSYNEKILFDMEIINESKNYDYSDLDLRIDLIKELKEGGTKNSDVIQLSKSDATYNGADIKNSINLYLNDEDIPKSNYELSNLGKGDKITISSDKFSYTITEYNSLKEKINYDYTLQFNYLNNYTFYKYTNTNNLKVKPTGGKLTITVKNNKEGYFYLKLKGEEDSSNIKVKSNKSYTISNLDYDREYELSLINSSSYNPVTNQRFVLKNDPNNNKKSITIDVNPKPNNYFTQRKIHEIIIDR